MRAMHVDRLNDIEQLTAWILQAIRFNLTWCQSLGRHRESANGCSEFPVLQLFGGGKRTGDRGPRLSHRP